MNNKNKHTLFIVIAVGLLLIKTEAAVVINVIQDGLDVKIIGTGSLNLNSVRRRTTGTAYRSFNARNDSDKFIGLFPETFDAYSISNLEVIGAIPTSNPFRSAGIGGNIFDGVFVNSRDGGKLFVPDEYVSNAPLDFTASISNYDFTDYGFSSGDSIVVSWSNRAFRETLTMNFFTAIPEPNSITLLFSAIGIITLLRRRNS